jgi:NAD(P)-dependent dehydrogenase (short-subunit alcohol dehydrogenase family)
MRILVVGASGTIGGAVADALSGRHEVIRASHSKSDEKVDLMDPASIRALLERIGRVDAIASAAGRAAFKPIADLADADFEFSLHSKLMGQVNLVRYGFNAVNDNGSITYVAGYLARRPAPGSAAASLVNAALEGFGRAAALEAPRGIRVNVVSPSWITETLQKLGRPLTGGTPVAIVAQSYVASIEGSETGQVFEPRA